MVNTDGASSATALVERNELIQRWLPMVSRVANDLWHGPKALPVVRRLGELDDVKQVGVEGLIRGLRCYDPQHESKASLNTYLYITIRRWIIRNAKGEGVVRVPASAVRSLEESEIGPVPASDDLLNKARHALYCGELAEDFDMAESSEDCDLDDQLLCDVADALDALPENERHLIETHFGFNGYVENQSLASQARQLGLPRKATELVFAVAIERLRDELQDKYGSNDDNINYGGDRLDDLRINVTLEDKRPMDDQVATQTSPHDHDPVRGSIKTAIEAAITKLGGGVTNQQIVDQVATSGLTTTTRYVAAIKCGLKREQRIQAMTHNGTQPVIPIAESVSRSDPSMSITYTATGPTGLPAMTGTVDYAELARVVTAVRGFGGPDRFQTLLNQVMGLQL